jgi:glycolate oxidase FAD binding subunit
MTSFVPSSATDVLGAVQWAAAEAVPLEVLGHGSRRGIGRPPQAGHALDLSQLSGVTLYEPEELVLSAKAGTPRAEIEALLAERGQQFAFEPMDCGPLLGGQSGRGTIGGVLASNLSGPRRIKAGAVRDHVLGIHAVSGRGEAFKSGGRVVKNVTGYDLSKVLAGSWGTLAVVTDVTFKVLPAAQTETTLVLSGLLDDAAAAAMALAMGSPAEVSAAAHLPEGIAAKASPMLEGAATIFRIEGFGPSVDYRVRLLRDLFGGHAFEEIAADDSRALWAALRDCLPFADDTERPVWRVSMAPTEGHRLALDLRRHAQAEVFYDWAGGLVWVRMHDDPEADLLRGLVRKFGGGHATLLRASPAHRAAVPVFEPQPPALAALSRRLKDQFDPKGILNPGRMG